MILRLYILFHILKRVGEMVDAIVSKTIFLEIRVQVSYPLFALGGNGRRDGLKIYFLDEVLVRFQ